MRAKYQGDPYSRAPWDEIIPGLSWAVTSIARYPGTWFPPLRGTSSTSSSAVRNQQKVLVRCHSGFNRSGLVVAQTLVHLGYRVDVAIFLVRYRRSKRALNNDLFVDYLTTGLDVARLLTVLGS